MDNAICAAAQSEKKLLDIQINYQRGMLLIQMKNSYCGTLIRAGEQYLSTKENCAEGQQVHGLGMKNVKRIVQKYNGSIEVRDEGQLFDVRILMYMCRWKLSFEHGFRQFIDGFRRFIQKVVWGMIYFTCIMITVRAFLSGALAEEY